MDICSGHKAPWAEGIGWWVSVALLETTELREWQQLGSSSTFSLEPAELGWGGEVPPFHTIAI